MADALCMGSICGQPVHGLHADFETLFFPQTQLVFTLPVTERICH